MSNKPLIQGNIYQRLHYILNDLEAETKRLHNIAHRCETLRIKAIKLASAEGEATSIWLAEECLRRNKAQNEVQE